MTNERKLELTLCGMLPYGLKIKTSMGVIPLVKSNHTVSLMNGLLIEDVESNKNYLPLLHSIDKLTEPILDCGLIPIVELAKMSTEKNTAEIYEDSEIISIRIANKSHYLLRFCYSKKNNDFYKTINGAEIPCKNQLELFEKLKEWHFNIYDLPKEMYIEKSNHQLLK